MIHFTQAEIDHLIDEDLPLHDETSRALGLAGKRGTMSIYSRESAAVASCTEEAARIARALDLEVTHMARSGQWLAPGENALSLRGDAYHLHCAWRLCLNLLEYASGVATYTRRMVEAAREAMPGIQVATTRKAVPGTRKLMFKSVLAGGGLIHRMGLSETVLVFAQHRQFLDDPADMRALIDRLRGECPEKRLMVEVTGREEAIEAALAGADVLQVDKMRPRPLAELVTAVREVRPRIVISAAGGVTLESAADYARSGVDLLVTSRPYHAAPADMGVRMESRKS
ncbi:MAG: ModD protein [Halothiobacillaceae bacterium]|jgi:molybdenum transport protein|nr:ModD protein [Halothiobacillaceae bacterium]MDY0049559.1 ModD protein [Halothiobacillaceae bacterium]